MLNPGQLQPVCDNEGAFQGRQSLPGLTTSCYSKAGERLFGESGTTQADQMACQCSRLHHGELSVEGLQARPHCLSDGDFDPLQCSNTTCFCVDRTNGTITSVAANKNFLVSSRSSAWTGTVNNRISCLPLVSFDQSHPFQ